MLQFERLEKSFGARSVIRNANGRFGPGGYALQGPNGIGKSTLLALLAGAVRPDAGDVRIDGLNLQTEPRAARQRLSYAPDESPIYPFIRGREFLEFVARTKGTTPHERLDSIIAGFGLTPHLDTRFKAMSLGTQKKFLLAAAWIGRPGVLLLDEPANGLDAQAREFLVRLFQHERSHSTILFSAHDADFVTATGAAIVTMEALMDNRSSSAA